MMRLMSWILGLVIAASASATDPVWVARRNDPWLKTSRSSVAYAGTGQTGLYEIEAGEPAWEMRSSLGAVTVTLGNDALSVIGISPDNHLGTVLVVFDAATAKINALDPTDVTDETKATEVVDIATDEPMATYYTAQGVLGHTMRILRAVVAGDYLVFTTYNNGATVGTDEYAVIWRGQWSGTAYGDWERCKLGSGDFSTAHGQLFLRQNPNPLSPYLAVGEYQAKDSYAEGGVNVYFSEDYGLTWSVINTPITAERATAMNLGDILQHDHASTVNSNGDKIVTVWGDPVLTGLLTWESATLYERPTGWEPGDGAWTKTTLSYDDCWGSCVWQGDYVLVNQHGPAINNGIGPRDSGLIGRVSTVEPYTVEMFVPYIGQDITQNPDTADQWGPYEVGDGSGGPSGHAMIEHGGMYWSAHKYNAAPASAIGLAQCGIWCSDDGVDWFQVWRPSDPDDLGPGALVGGASGYVYCEHTTKTPTTVVLQISTPSVAVRPAWTISRAVTNVWDKTTGQELSSLVGVTAATGVSTYTVIAGEGNAAFYSIDGEGFHATNSLEVAPDPDVDPAHSFGVYTSSANTDALPWPNATPRIHCSAWTKAISRGSDYRLPVGWSLRTMPRNTSGRFDITASYAYRQLIWNNWTRHVHNLYAIGDPATWYGYVVSHYYRGRTPAYQGTFTAGAHTTCELPAADAPPVADDALNGKSIYVYSAAGDYKATITILDYVGSGGSPPYECTFAEYTAAEDDIWIAHLAVASYTLRTDKTSFDTLIDALQVTMSADRYYLYSQPYTPPATVRDAEYLRVPMSPCDAAWSVAWEWLPMEGWAMSIADNDALAGDDIPILSVVSVDGSYIDLYYDFSEKKLTATDGAQTVAQAAAWEYHHFDRVRFVLTTDGTDSVLTLNSPVGTETVALTAVNIGATPSILLIGTLHDLADQGYGRIIGPTIYDEQLTGADLTAAMEAAIPSTRGTWQQEAGAREMWTMPR